MRNQVNSQDAEKLGDSFTSATGGTLSKKKYSSPITLRVTDEERERLLTDAAGMSVSAYIRKCVFGDAVAPRKIRSKVPVKDQAALARILGMMGQSRIANNLNQLAYQANTGSLLVDEKTEKEIHEAYAHTLFIRAELVKALGLIESA